MSIGPGVDLPESARRLLHEFLRYWRSKCGDGRLPTRAAIDPLEIPQLLPWIAVLDVTADDYRFRLVGEGVNARYGGQLRGRGLRDLMSGPALAETLLEHDLCVRERRPIYVENTSASTTEEDLWRYQRLTVPCAADGTTIDTLIGAMHVLV
ncbi:MAG: PAS domain-containing protein [Dongiaceae bacterium]